MQYNASLDHIFRLLEVNTDSLLKLLHGFAVLNFPQELKVKRNTSSMIIYYSYFFIGSLPWLNMYIMSPVFCSVNHSVSMKSIYPWVKILKYYSFSIIIFFCSVWTHKKLEINANEYYYQTSPLSVSGFKYLKWQLNQTISGRNKLGTCKWIFVPVLSQFWNRQISHNKPTEINNTTHNSFMCVLKSKQLK